MGLKKEIDIIIEEIESAYPSQGSANYDGGYTKKLVALFKKHQHLWALLKGADAKYPMTAFFCQKCLKVKVVTK